jgi:hypothetical protein
VTKKPRERRHLIQRPSQPPAKLLVGDEDGVQLLPEVLKNLNRMYDAGDQVARIFDHWRRWANALIESEGKNPKDYRTLAKGDSDGLDRVRAAALVLVRLDRIKAYVRRPGVSMAALVQALLLASDVHQLTVVDNERDIVRGEADREELAAKNAKRRSAAEPGHADVRSRAERVWKKHPELTASAVARIIEPECPDYEFGTIRKLIRQK